MKNFKKGKKGQQNWPQTESMIVSEEIIAEILAFSGFVARQIKSFQTDPWKGSAGKPAFSSFSGDIQYR